MALDRARALLPGRPAEARRRGCERGPRATEGSRYGPYRVHALGSLALARGLAGRLVRAAELADEALGLARELQLLNAPRSGRRLSRPRARRDPARRAGGRRFRTPRRPRPRVVERSHAADVDRARRVSSHRPRGDGCGGRPADRLAPASSWCAAPCEPIARQRIRQQRRPGVVSAESEWSTVAVRGCRGPPGCPVMRAARACGCRPRSFPTRPSPEQIVENDILLRLAQRRRRTPGASLAAAPGRARRGRERGSRASLRERRRACRGAPPGSPRQPAGFRAVVLDRFAPDAASRARRSSSSPSRRASWSCSRFCPAASRMRSSRPAASCRSTR